MGTNWVGLYWTLPVHWAGFRDLPPSVEAAAAASRTIRYQRRRAQQHVGEQGGRMAGEIAFMDTRPDRATDAVRDVLRRHAPAPAPSPAAARPTLLTVRFDQARGWRPNPFIRQVAEELGLPLLDLPPDPVVIDGAVFDPAQHFGAWRRRDESAMARLRLEAAEGLRAALDVIPEGPGRWQAIAGRLNDAGTRTIRGGGWTAENVRKLTVRMGLARGRGEAGG